MLLNNMYPFGSAMSGRTQLLICKASASSLIYIKTRRDLKINTFLLNSVEHTMFVTFKSITYIFRESRPQMVSAVA